MKKRTIITAILVLFILGLVTAGLVFKFVINKPHKDYEKAKPAFIISAADLYDSFQANRAEAEKKFNGQVVLLSGKLDKIETSEDIVTGVFVFNQGMFGDEGIRCTMLPAHAATLKAIPEGSEVQIKGYLTGYNDTDVILEMCSIIR
jgi:hypothetical protein